MDIVDWIFFGPARLIAIWPYAGVIIAAALIGFQLVLTLRRDTSSRSSFFREAAVFSGILWLIFNAFELQMSAIAAQSGNGAPLRLDLMVLVPILYVLTAAGLYSLFRQMRGPASAEVPTADSSKPEQ
ncbi:MAG: hypothetical protein ABI905_12855 [Betaproteobacteria bacterium]